MLILSKWPAGRTIFLAIETGTCYTWEILAFFIIILSLIISPFILFVSVAALQAEFPSHLRLVSIYSFTCSQLVDPRLKWHHLKTQVHHIDKQDCFFNCIKIRGSVDKSNYSALEKKVIPQWTFHFRAVTAWDSMREMSRKCGSVYYDFPTSYNNASCTCQLAWKLNCRIFTFLRCASRGRTKNSREAAYELKTVKEKIQVQVFLTPIFISRSN